MKKIFYTMLLIVLCFGFSQNVLAIGQMTEPIVIKDVLRGQAVTATLNLFNSEESATIYGLKAEGEIADWTSFYQIADKDLANPITEIEIPASSFIGAIVEFKVPEDAPNGDYKGEVILFNGVAGEAKEGEVNTTVFQSVGRQVLISVTDKEIIKFQTSIIPLKYEVKKGEPLQIKVIYENQGNITIKPDLQLKILKDENIVYNAILPYPENESPVKPLERKTMANLVEWQTNRQEDGIYRAEVDILLNGEVYQEENFKFTIGQNGKILGISIGKWQINWWMMAIALVVIVAIVVISIIGGKRKKKMVNGN